MPGAPATSQRMATSIGLPHPPYLLKVIRRSAGMWILVRCMYVVLTLMFEDPASARHPDGTTRAVLVAVTAFLVWWDRRRFRELLFFANLGTRPGWFLAASLLTASVLDIVVQTVLAML